MTIFGYARVSTDGQTLDAQLEALQAEGAAKTYREKISGARADRPELRKLLAAIGQGDVLLVTRLDRLARSTRDLWNIVEELKQRGAGLRSLNDKWADTTTPQGRLMLTVMSGIAEFERALIVSRTKEGRDRAVARGGRIGRKPKLTPAQVAQDMADLRAGRVTQADLARRHEIHRSAISRMVAKAEATQPAGRPPAPRQPDPETATAAAVFLDRIKGRYAQALLYGSRARGDHTPDSDADIAVILNGPKGDRYAEVCDLSGIAYDVLMETGIHIQAMPLWEEELRRPELHSNPTLLANIMRDGIRL